jgi:hypothetical protein
MRIKKKRKEYGYQASDDVFSYAFCGKTVFLPL